MSTSTNKDMRIIDLESQNKSENKEEKSSGSFLICIPCFCGGLLIMGLIGCSVSYYVFSIMALVEDSHDSIQKECKNSNIWPYLLVVIIMNLVVANKSKRKEENKEGEMIMDLFVSLLIIVSLCTWGSIEFWNDCVQDKLSNTLVFKMVQITVYFQYSVISIIICTLIFICKNLSNKVETTIQKT